jgi:hypothetical protein
MTHRGHTFALIWLMAWWPASAAAAEVVAVSVDPETVELRGPTSTYSLLVTGKTADGRLVDRTRAARYHALDDKVATVTEAGVVHPVADGATTIIIEADGKAVKTTVRIRDMGVARKFNFENDVVTIFSRFGCNASGCHGKAEGQNGFKLSVFGFDPAADYAAIAKEARGRRVFPASPENSLLLRKMTGQMAHGGGNRVARNSGDYETVRAWIAAGMPFGSPDDPKVKAIRVEPRERVLGFHEQQQLRVVASYSDGHESDVTALAKFQTNNELLASVSATGLVTANDVPGDAALMASFLSAVDTFRVVVPRGEAIENYPTLPENNFIDKHVNQKLRKLNILPSDPANDAEFLRRVYLDVIGMLPTPAEARRFLSDTRPGRRARLVDELLERREFADYFALQWADLLRVDRQALGHKRAYAYYKWICDAVSANKPVDQFAREVVTAEGVLGETGPTSFYKAVTKPGERASTLSQVFLGVRIACAECHHHPYDRWAQADYYGMTAYFAGVMIKGAPAGEMVVAEGKAVSKNPRTGDDVPAHALGEKPPATTPTGDRRGELAGWLTSPDNPYFARNVANRLWAHFLGRGLVEPVDDVRESNPPTNPELLDALARHLADNKYDIKALIRAITASRAYQRSSQTNATNERDEQNYSRALFRRPGAEVLLDMVCQTTGVKERFAGMPPGTRAVQLWDSKAEHYFLKVFGRPERVSACECERNAEPSVAQVLHLLNSPEIHDKVAHEAGYVAKLVKREPKDEAVVEELYLTFYGRLPSEKERGVALAYLQEHKDKRRPAVEDLAWTLLNTTEFVFNH